VVSSSAQEEGSSQKHLNPCLAGTSEENGRLENKKEKIGYG